MSEATDAIRLYYKNVMLKGVGPEHGLPDRELDGLAGGCAAIVERVEAERGEGKHRYRELPYDQAMLKAVQEACKRHRGRYENLVVCGIGGSALGNIALQTALNPYTYNMQPSDKRGGPRLFVLDNVDPVQFAEVLDLLDGGLDKTLFNVISKSGETAETASQFLIVRDMLRQRLGAEGQKKHMLVTTDAAKGTMRQIVNAEGYESLPVPDGVGGRFSVLSAVGLFSAGMCGGDIESLLAGARDMDQRVKSTELRTNPAALLAAIHHLMYHRGKCLHVMMPYSYRLKDLADWYRQLWAESLGKQRSLSGADIYAGPTPIKALGATDQHSQIQLYREGPNDKVITTLAVDHFDRDVTIPKADKNVEAMGYLGGKKMGDLLNAERQATEQALVASRRPTLTIRFPRINAHTVGQFIYLYEAATTIAGRLFSVDAYDQPAVELGKIYTFALMGRTGHEDAARELTSKLAEDPEYLA